MDWCTTFVQHLSHLCSALHLGSTLGRQGHLLYEALTDFSSTTESMINSTFHSITGRLTHHKSQTVRTEDLTSQSITPTLQPPYRGKTDICQRWVMFQGGGIAEQRVTRCSDNHLPLNVSRTKELVFVFQRTKTSVAERLLKDLPPSVPGHTNH